MENSIVQTILIVLVVLVLLSVAGACCFYLLKRYFKGTVKAVGRSISDSQLVVRSVKTSTGRQLVIQVSPYEVENNDPVFPDEPMSGESMPFELLDKFFSNSLPESQMLYIINKLRMQGMDISLNNQSSPKSDSLKEEASGGADRDAEGNSVKDFTRVESAPQGEAGPELPEEEAEEQDPADDDSYREKGPVSFSTDGEEGVSDPMDIVSPFDAVDNEPRYDNIRSSADLPAELLDVLLNPSDQRMMVACYYCACRLGLDINYKFDPSCKEDNITALRSIRATYDKSSNDDVVFFTLNYCNLGKGGDVVYKPVFTEGSRGGVSLARRPEEVIS